VLGQPTHQRGWLLAHDHDPLPPELANTLEKLAQRRLTGEPLAYLTGHKEFFGLDLQVNPCVLVPRPDTETLVSWALEVLTAEAPNQLQHARPLAVLDLGTGSGAIALALKAERPDWHIYATDICQNALKVARANARRLQLDVNFSQGEWFTHLTDPTLKLDCIVSNPPYIAALDPHMAALSHEPLQALTSGADGLNDLRQIIAQAPVHIRTGGWLLLEHGYDQAHAVRTLLETAGFSQVQSHRDLAGIERCSGGIFKPNSIL
jgi:release factor glutamine methyltransferase